MRVELNVATAGGYIRTRGYEPKEIVELSGGVSNNVLRISTDNQCFIVKQSLPRLRVQMEWFSDPSRIFRESGALKWLSGRLPEGAVPRVLFEDPEQFAFAMTSAPDGARTWKSHLLEGETDSELAVEAGRLQASMAASTWNDANALAEFGDRRFFHELRLDPYYRVTAGRHPDLARHIGAVIEATESRQVCLVHGDWSPKNFLVSPTPGPSRLMAIDFEVIHYGDPSFDTAFLLNHLLLKSFHRPSSAPAYRAMGRCYFSAVTQGLPEQPCWFEPAVMQHLGCLLLARIDGKSPVEYLTDEGVRQSVRDLARSIIVDCPRRVGDVFVE